MTEQEARWLYAKGLELAIILKGPADISDIESSVSDMLFRHYHELAKKIAIKIACPASELLPKGQK
jgi:hypothetical protein